MSKDENCGKCKNCGKDMRLIKGKYGDFYSCSGYPTCKTTKNILAPVMCSACLSPMYEKRGIRGEFYGCSTYPLCKNTVGVPKSNNN